MDNNKPVEVNDTVFIIDDIKKICKFNKTFQEFCCVLGQWYKSYVLNSFHVAKLT